MGKFIDQVKEMYSGINPESLGKVQDPRQADGEVVDPGGRRAPVLTLSGGGLRGTLDPETGQPVQEGLFDWDADEKAGNYSTSVLYIPLVETPVQNTAGRPLVPVGPPKGCTAREFGQLIAASYRVYLEQGTLEAGEISGVSGISPARVVALTQTQEFGYACAVRGIEVGDEHFLSEEMDRVLMLIGDTTSKLTHNERLRKAQVSSTKLRAWRKNKVFNRLYTELTEGTASDYNAAMLELHRKAGDGDLRAIEKVLEISGRYNGNTQQLIDAHQFVNRVLEILAHRLAGYPELLQAIAADMRGVETDLNHATSGTKILEG